MSNILLGYMLFSSGVIVGLLISKVVVNKVIKQKIKNL
jgi:hypothetical protein